jgi:hypothetical protein
MTFIAPSENRTEKGHIREKATIDHLVKEAYEVSEPKRRVHSATTETGLSIADQVCKQWDSRNGGLPILAILP